eukprot:TRINITY_DN5780_c0_g1_i5.p1 TRINITY_DN5780_c0_g1~~TRINITY_DN5780_c0_g1_i5.p1  ORF type:complete len:316 (-),score=51.27 TRINITY_DN5780_c0_g1_i5:77-1024(-)
MKVSATLIAQSSITENFWESDSTMWIVTELASMLKNMKPEFKSNIPPLFALPTTAGTGSEGGKSAVILNPNGHKKVYGNPVLVPQYVALVPQLTEKLPPFLTAATGIDALSHLLEAWFVPPETVLFPDEGGPQDGYLSKEDVTRCDRFALEGIDLVVRHLPEAFKNGNDQRARLNMQIAALFGAKAFRKGDLGGIHATAHTIGSLFHLHHGTAIARMMVPVLRFNESKIGHTGCDGGKFQQLHDIFLKHGYTGSSLSVSVLNFLSQFGIPTGIRDLKDPETNIATLSLVASQDPCQTNPVPLTLEDYRLIFESAS